MAKDISAKFRAIERQSYQAGIAVMQDVARAAIRKARNEVAMNCLRRYYAYYKPKMYIRTKNLQRAITPILRQRHDKNKYTILLGIHFDSSKLNGVYQSNSWYHQSGGKWVSRNDSSFNWKGQNNGIVDPSWVLENFLEGRHPDMYSFKQDPTTTHEVMTEFFEEDMAGLLAGLIAVEFPKAVKNFLGI